MLNQINIQGRIVRDPELRRTGSGNAVTSFTLACDRDFKNAQTGEKEVDFLDCVAWGSTGETVAKYFAKGQLAAVSGRLQIRQYTDKSGQKRRQAEILVSSVYFCGGKENGSAGGTGADSGHNAPVSPAENFAVMEDNDTQLPF